MNYYELAFTYASTIEISIINDVLAAELGEIGFRVLPKTKTGCQDTFPTNYIM